jgi:hypothetical protein
MELLYQTKQYKPITSYDKYIKKGNEAFCIDDIIQLFVNNDIIAHLQCINLLYLRAVYPTRVRGNCSLFIVIC